MARSFVSAERLAGEPYSGILGYPKATARQIRSRIDEMRRLGISSVSLTGPTALGGLAVLGKGYVGVVVLARRRGRRVALKIRRTDSQRRGMAGEAALLRRANSVGVGPEAVAASRNFLVMGLAGGVRIDRWVDSLGGRGSAGRLKSVVRRVLEDCYRLDQIGLDHGELSDISKHVMVDDAGLLPTMIDFESSSTGRRPSNVTSAAQAIFIGSGIARRAQRIYRNPPKEAIIEALRGYKREGTRESFERLLRALRL